MNTRGRVDHDAPTPAYHQVASDLRQRLRREEFSPGSRLPSEAEMATLYGVSRMTLRQALGDLAKDGLVIRKHGRGTFVGDRISPIVHDLSAPLVFAARVREQGISLRPRMIEVEETHAVPRRVREALGRDAGAAVLHMLRLFETPTGPVELVHHWFDPVRFAGLKDEPLHEHSVTRTLAEQYGASEAEADVRMEALRGLPEECALLGIDSGETLVSLSRTVYDETGEAFTCSQSLWNASSISFNFHVRSHTDRPGSAPSVLLSPPRSGAVEGSSL